MFSALAFLQARHCGKVFPLQVHSLQQKQKLSRKDPATAGQRFAKKNLADALRLCVFA